MDRSPSSLHHALDTLEAFQYGSKDFSARELHQMLGIPRATQYRLLRVLEQRGYLRRDSQSGRYKLGYKILQLSASAQEQIELVDLAQGVLQRMWGEAKETTHLAVLDGVEVMYLRVLESPTPHQFVLRAGIRAPSHCVSPGRAMLAFAPGEKVEEVIAAGLKPLTDRTVLTAEGLRERLADVRRRGSSVNRGQWRERGGGVSAPVFDYRGEAVAAVGLSGPIDRLTEDRIPVLGRIAVRGAEEISKALGAERAPARAGAG